jgi:glycosidase
MIFEFHISRETRNLYQFDEALFAQTGNVIFIDFYRVRIFADKMNKRRDLISSPEKAIKAGSLNAMGLIDEILHYIVGLYKEQIDKNIFTSLEKKLIKELGEKKYVTLLEKFTEQFPPLSVYRNEIDTSTYLKKNTDGVKNRQVVLEEILLLYLANKNPAFNPFKELFDDTNLSKETAYLQAISSIDVFFEGQPFFGPDVQNLVQMLRTPALKFPNSLSSQLEFIRTHWGYMLSKYILRLFSSLDMIKEEEKAIFSGSGPSYVLDFDRLTGEDEPERFSEDLDWMPKVVMIAKSTYVWMDQLSKKYSRHIRTLADIPDEELDLLASRGFNALWLIGLWERSSASQKIKQICGNPEAVSSAYSLYDYTIAADLGGEEDYRKLQNRAWKRGLRLASDMVPNHTGIYSKWVIEHPHWYIQADNPVFPGYNFNGPNLSEDDRVSLFIEDGYWNRSDAAVLFKRVDNFTGSVTYIYHGNDGTSMPWNDTAQLNYLLPEVREAVIQTIIHVARKFPIIRLDAAMTLAKKHFQRLWFPQPGSGGDIPSRAGFAMTREQFDKAFPVEFWREVVDRVAKEVPDTLLLAEAFWMMEGYFVRTLGMHRVYNSAFMNMLKNEDNQNYRLAIKNVLDFNPEIMKRYVNFMNNPDEETAIAQFGKDDKYFGVCTLMATLPGLPMFGHGQIEGFSEKYGMEYQKAYWDEIEDEHLISRHEQEIFPLLKKRYLFSEVQNFILYDLIGPEGYVNEDVFAFTNRSGGEKALVLYNNRYERSTGWIKYSSASAQKSGNGFIQYSLSEGLLLNPGTDRFIIFRDQISKLEYIRSNDDLVHHGIFVELDGFKYHVFLDFREIQDNEFGHYSQLCSYLGGRGVPSIDQAMKETFLSPIHEPFLQLTSVELLKRIDELMIETKKPGNQGEEVYNQFNIHLSEFMYRIQKYTSTTAEIDPIVNEALEKLKYLINLNQLGSFLDIKVSPNLGNALEFVYNNVPPSTLLSIWLTVSKIGRLQDENYAAIISISWLDEFLLNKLILQSFHEEGYDDYSSDRHLLLLKILILLSNWLTDYLENPVEAIQSLFQYQEVQKYIGINQYQEILYFHYESLIELLGAFYTAEILEISLWKNKNKTAIKKKLVTLYSEIEKIIKIAGKNGCKVYATIEAIQELKSQIHPDKKR